jgi:hypothetical protein
MDRQKAAKTSQVSCLTALADAAMGPNRSGWVDRWWGVGTIPWYGPECSLDDLVVYQMYGHKREHDPQLSSVLDDAADVFVRPRPTSRASC